MTSWLNTAGPCHAAASSPSAHVAPGDGPTATAGSSRAAQQTPSGGTNRSTPGSGTRGWQWGGVRGFSHQPPTPIPLLAAFPRGGAGPEAGSRSQRWGWKVGSGPRVSAPTPGHAGASTGNGAGGPTQGNRLSITQASCVGGAEEVGLPQEARARLLQSPIKLLAPQMRGWKPGAHPVPPALLPGHPGANGTVTIRDPLGQRSRQGTWSLEASSSCLHFPSVSSRVSGA